MEAVRQKATRKIGTVDIEFDAAFDKARVEIKKQLNSTASSHSRLLYFQRTLEHLGLRSQAVLSLEFEQTYWGRFFATMELREGVIGFLEQLSRLSIPKIIITDLITRIQLRKLIYLELDQHFEYVVTSEESGADKPDRKSFDLAMEKLALLAPKEEVHASNQIWMIGDNIITDIEGAKKSIDATTLGLKSEICDQNTNASLDMVFDSFRDLERLFLKTGWDKQQ